MSLRLSEHCRIRLRHLLTAPSQLTTSLCALSEWITHQHRDTSAAIVGHPPLHSYVALADGESKARVKFELCEVSIWSAFWDFGTWLDWNGYGCSLEEGVGDHPREGLERARERREADRAGRSIR